MTRIAIAAAAAGLYVAAGPATIRFEEIAQRAGPKRPYHVRVFVSLGDGYWKMGDRDKAVAAWKEGLAEFPDSAALKTRLSATHEALDALIADAYDYTKRVDTSLQDLWANP